MLRPILLVSIVGLSACNIGHMSRMDEFKLRSECATQAEKVIAEPRWKPVGSGMQIKTTENHYNRQLNRCFVNMHTANGEISVDALIDAYEGTTLIGCIKYLGEERACNTQGITLKPEEADRRIKDYMER